MNLGAINWRWGNGPGKGVANSYIDRNTGKIIIDSWRHPTLPKPTAAEIQLASDDYERHLIAQATQAEKDYKKIKIKLKAKLDLDDSEFEIFEKFFKSKKDGG